jgi:hypothetical protein
MSDPTAAANLGIFTSHGYTAPPNSTITSIGSRHAWETEWTPSANENNWDPAWDDGTDASGFTWANRIYTGLTSANLSAFNYWWGANTSNSNSGVVELSGSTVTPAARLWAFANYSRFMRPGAVRVSGTSSDSNLDVTAVKNTDGTYTVVVLNTASSSISASIALQNVGAAFAATPYLTNGSNNTAQQATIAINGGAFAATIPARSLVTYKISVETPITPTPTRTGATPTPTPTMSATSTPTPPPTPTSTPSSGGNGVTASGVVASNSPYFGEEDIKFSNTSSITALTATITVQKTTGVSYSSAYTTFGGVTMTHADNGSTITYTFTLNSGQSLSPGSYLTAAQFGGTGTAHSTTGDLWSITTTTSGGVANTLSGHF